MLYNKKTKYQDNKDLLLKLNSNVKEKGYKI